MRECKSAAEDVLRAERREQRAKVPEHAAAAAAAGEGQCLLFVGLFDLVACSKTTTTATKP
jgi:hypothetical protein